MLQVQKGQMKMIHVDDDETGYSAKEIAVLHT